MFRILLSLILLVVASTFLVAVESQSCSNVQAPNLATSTFASRCYGIIQYTVRNATMCLKDMENSMSLVDYASSLVRPSCHQALTVFHCRIIFTPCDAATPFDALPPPEVCTNLNQACLPQELAAVNQLYATFGVKLPPTLPSPGFSAVCSNDSTVVAPLNFAANARKPLCEAYTGSVCKGVIDYQVYVQQQYATLIGGQLVTTQAVVEAQLQSAQFLFYLLPQPCRDVYIKLVCASALPKCVDATPTLPIKVPSLPDRSLCTLVSQSCPASVLFSPLSNLLQLNNCTSMFDTSAGSYITPTNSCSTVPPTMLPRFPDNQLIFNGIPVQSNKNPENVSSASIFNSLPACPAPTVKTSDSAVAINGGSCAPPCPPFLYTSDEYAESDRLLLGISTTSTICISIQLLTFLMIKRSRRSRYAIYFSATIWLISWSIMFGGVAETTTDVEGRYARMRCKDSSHLSRRGYCLWLSMVMTYGGMSAVCWWFVQAIDLYLNIAWGASKWAADKTRKKDIIYHSFGFGYPICTLIVYLSLDILGSSSQGIPYCTFNDDTHAKSVSWGLFYGPIFFQCVCGCLLMVFIIRQLWISSVQLQAHKKRGWWKLYIKPLLFVFLLEFVWLFIFAYVLYGEDHTKQFTRQAEDMLSCVLVQRPTAAALGQTISCPEGPRPNLGLFYMIQIAVGGVGLWTFILYFSRDYLRDWHYIVTCRHVPDAESSTGSTTNTDQQATSPRSGGGSRRVLRKKPNSPLSTGASSQALTGSGNTTTISTEASTDDLSAVPLDKPLPTNIELSYDRPPSVNRAISSHMEMNNEV